MSARYTTISNPLTSEPYLGVVAFNGGFDYFDINGHIKEGSLPTQETLVDRYVEMTGKSEDDLTIDDYCSIAVLPFNNQGAMVDGWNEEKNRSKAKNQIIAILQENELLRSDSFAQKVESASSFAIEAGTYAGVLAEGEEEDMINAADLIMNLLNTVDPDGPDGWRIKYLLEEFASTNDL